MRTARAAFLVAALVAGPTAAAAQDHRDMSAWKGPAGWRIVPDRPAPDSVLAVVAMPPGWHVTLGPGAFMGDTGWRAAGHYTLEMESFLFPGTSQEGYGLFLGGRTGEGGPTHLTVLLRRDGSLGVFRGKGVALEPVHAWSRHPEIKAHDGGNGTARNILRVAVGEEKVVVSVNGAALLELPASLLGGAGGHYGLRVGEGLNMHFTRVDHTPQRHAH